MEDQFLQQQITQTQVTSSMHLLSVSHYTDGSCALSDYVLTKPGVLMSKSAMLSDRDCTQIINAVEILESDFKSNTIDPVDNKLEYQVVKEHTKMLGSISCLLVLTVHLLSTLCTFLMI